MIFDVYSSYTNRVCLAPLKTTASLAVRQPSFLKKSVRWSDNLVEVRYYEKPFRKGSYGELSERLGKPVRVLGKPERVLGKPVRVPVKVEKTRQ